MDSLWVWMGKERGPKGQALSLGPEAGRGRQAGPAGDMGVAFGPRLGCCWWGLPPAPHRPPGLRDHPLGPRCTRTMVPHCCEGRPLGLILRHAWRTVSFSAHLRVPGWWLTFRPKSICRAGPSQPLTTLEVPDTCLWASWDILPRPV